MPRIRTIKPEFCTSEQVAECSRDARLLFVCMWCFCDDAGRHKASVRKLKMECLPGDAVGDAEVTQWIDELIQNDLLEEYTVNGESYWQVCGWHHQKIDQPNVKHPNEDGKVERFAKRLGGKQRQILKEKLIERDGEKCVNCGSKANLSIDHITPRSKGGTHELDNLQLLCRPCNNEKHAKVLGGDAAVTHPRKGREGKGEEGKGMERNGRESNEISYVSLQTDECESEKDSPCEVVDAWNDRCDETDDPRMKPVRLTPKRRDKLKTRLSEAAFRDCWRLAIDNLPNPVRKNFDWTPDFDWLIKNDTNAVKIAEGVYASTTSDAAIAKARQSITEDF